MLAFVKPARPACVRASPIDRPILPLLAAASSGRPLVPAMQSVMRRHGFDHFMYERLPDRRPQRDVRCWCWATHSRAWLDLYDRRAYAEVDPRVVHTFDHATPLMWDSATLRGRAHLSRFLDDAASFGIRSGVSISFRDAERARIIVSLNSAVSPVDRERHAGIANRIGDFMLLATRFHDVFMAPAVGADEEPAAGTDELSARERRCLQLAAEGLTSAEIGRTLAVTARTAQFHLANIYAKLGVVNRQQAIARGIAAGLIAAPP